MKAGCGGHARHAGAAKREGRHDQKICNNDK